jgi:hypothetical protein
LISLKWSRSRNSVPTGDPDAFEGFRQRADEAGAVRQPGEGVVQHPVPERLVGEMALDGVGEDVGGGLHEVDVLRGEPTGAGRVDVEHAERHRLALDHDRKTAANAEHPQSRWHRVALLGRPVVDDHVQSGLDRGAGV